MWAKRGWCESQSSRRLCGERGSRWWIIERGLPYCLCATIRCVMRWRDTMSWGWPFLPFSPLHCIILLVSGVCLLLLDLGLDLHFHRAAFFSPPGVYLALCPPFHFSCASPNRCLSVVPLQCRLARTYDHMCSKVHTLNISSPHPVHQHMYILHTLRSMSHSTSTLRIPPTNPT